MKLYDCLMKLLKFQTPRYGWNNHLQINQVINQSIKSQTPKHYSQICKNKTNKKPGS